MGWKWKYCRRRHISTTTSASIVNILCRLYSVYIFSLATSRFSVYVKRYKYIIPSCTMDVWIISSRVAVITVDYNWWSFDVLIQHAASTQPGHVCTICERPYCVLIALSTANPTVLWLWIFSCSNSRPHHTNSTPVTRIASSRPTPILPCCVELFCVTSHRWHIFPAVPVGTDRQPDP